jgi:GTP cyclohydrolase I
MSIASAAGARVFDLETGGPKGRVGGGKPDIEGAALAARDFLKVLGVACDSPSMARSAVRMAEAYAEMRGVRAGGALTRTSALAGVLREDASTRAEFFAVLQS